MDISHLLNDEAHPDGLGSNGAHISPDLHVDQSVEALKLESLRGGFVRRNDRPPVEDLVQQQSDHEFEGSGDRCGRGLRAVECDERIEKKNQGALPTDTVCGSVLCAICRKTRPKRRRVDSAWPLDTESEKALRSGPRDAPTLHNPGLATISSSRDPGYIRVRLPSLNNLIAGVEERAKAKSRTRKGTLSGFKESTQAQSEFLLPPRVGFGAIHTSRVKSFALLLEPVSEEVSSGRAHRWLENEKVIREQRRRRGNIGVEDLLN
ncbi:hypothetical protein K432DRAFT_440772 [Lepidopterella palustris CBS 459.81]|uniref:Uncharacterized protein n=1 Tax=Lepidopterella palustris CBS 459.81 TaxID=1314670 RepID=A0A8E2JI54_9PEZI|nr:hypothetical protein K432DRAFT_440772 [Lepidopterella palustris CBS 459.81]